MNKYLLCCIILYALGAINNGHGMHLKTLSDQISQKRSEIRSIQNIFAHTYNRGGLDTFFNPISETKQYIDGEPAAHSDATLQNALNQIVDAFNSIVSNIRQAYNTVLAPNVNFKSDVAEKYQNIFLTKEQSLKQLVTNLKGKKYYDQVLKDACNMLIETAEYVRLMAKKAYQDFRQFKPTDTR